MDVGLPWTNILNHCQYLSEHRFSVCLGDYACMHKCKCVCGCNNICLDLGTQERTFVVIQAPPKITVRGPTRLIGCTAPILSTE